MKYEKRVERDVIRHIEFIETDASDERELELAYARFLNDLSVDDAVRIAFSSGIYLGGWEGQYRLMIMDLSYETNLALKQAFGDWVLIDSAVDGSGCGFAGVNLETSEAWYEAWAYSGLDVEMEEKIFEVVKSQLYSLRRKMISIALENLEMLEEQRKLNEEAYGYPCLDNIN